MDSDCSSYGYSAPDRDIDYGSNGYGCSDSYAYGNADAKSHGYRGSYGYSASDRDID